MLSIVITLAGGVAVFTLPLAQFPSITPPTVQVTALYPGASARDVAEAVAWLDTLDPSVDLPEIRLNAVRRGPFAREPVVPTEARRRAAQQR